MTSEFNDDLAQLLAHASPSVRSKAVNQVIGMSGSRIPAPLIEALHRQLARETVPMIATNIRRAISATTALSDQATNTAIVIDATRREPRAVELLAELSEMIRHELSPAIGAIRYTASLAVDDFANSEVNAAIDGLIRRLDGLVALARASALPVSEIASLGVLLEQSVPSDAPGSLLTLDATEDADDDTIGTDVGLFTLLMTNVFQNAIDAVSALTDAEAREIFVASGVTPNRFWVRVSNRFMGSSFQLADVSASGVSTKHDHRGLGARVMRLCADRLGYQIDLSAAGGVASFTVRGGRHYVPSTGD